MISGESTSQGGGDGGWCCYLSCFRGLIKALIVIALSPRNLFSSSWYFQYHILTCTQSLIWFVYYMLNTIGGSKPWWKAATAKPGKTAVHMTGPPWTFHVLPFSCRWMRCCTATPSQPTAQCSMKPQNLATSHGEVSNFHWAVSIWASILDFYWR